MEASTRISIGILGSGNMGRALGVRFANLGHRVYFGGRDPQGAPFKSAELARFSISGFEKSTVNVESGTLDDAARFGTIIIWTMRERDPHNVLSEVGVKELEGKVVFDINNRDYANEVVGPDSRWFSESLGEQLQAHLPKAHVLKAFNTIAMEGLDVRVEAIKSAGAQVTLAGGPNCSEKSRTLSKGLIEELGFQTIDLGATPTAMRIAEAMGDIVRYIMIDGKAGPSVNLGIRAIPKPDLNLIGSRANSSYH